jgi:hypothetical protein
VGKISPKGDIKNLAFKNQFIGESRKGFKKSPYFFIFGFQCVAISIEGWLNFAKF